jgi:hypothetical protein
MPVPVTTHSYLMKTSFPTYQILASQEKLPWRAPARIVLWLDIESRKVAFLIKAPGQKTETEPCLRLTGESAGRAKSRNNRFRRGN